MFQVVSEESAGGAMQWGGQSVPLQHHLTKAGVLAREMPRLSSRERGEAFFVVTLKGLKTLPLLRLLGVFALGFQHLDLTLFRDGQLAIRETTPFSTQNGNPGAHIKKAVVFFF